MPTASQIRDITTAYLEDNVTKDKWSNVVRDYQHHVVADELFAKRIKTGAASEKMTFTVKSDEADNTVADEFFQKDTLNRIDLFRKGELNWHFQKTHFMVDRREPALMSGNKVRIFNYLEGQKSDMYDGFFKRNEVWLWTLAPAPNTAEPLPFTIPYWVVAPSAAALSLQGDTPSGYSTVGNISSTTVPYWKNWGFKWTSMSNSDFCKKASSMMRRAYFKPPKPVKEEEVAGPTGFALYSDETPFQDYEDALYGSNENVGEDMGKWRAGNRSGTVDTHMFQGVPWRWVPALSEAGPAQLSSSRVYFLNWDSFRVDTYSDLFMDLSDPLTLTDQHNTNVTWMDSAWQMCCINRRANGCAEQA